MGILRLFVHFIAYDLLEGRPTGRLPVCPLTRHEKKAHQQNQNLLQPLGLSLDTKPTWFGLW